MIKKVLDVGNCGPDHAAISDLLTTFNVQLTRAHGLDDAMACLRAESFDLVMINRLMDRDGSSGMEIISTIKSDEALARIPVMLISNFPEYQELAVAAGAETGFGKRQLGDAATLELLKKYLS